MKYTLIPDTWALDLNKLKGKEVESVHFGEYNVVRFPRIKCVNTKVFYDRFISIELENGVTFEGRSLVVETNEELETKDIWDLTSEDIGKNLRVVIDGTFHEGRVSDFSRSLTYFQDKDTGKIRCEGERDVLIGEQRIFSVTKKLY